MKLIDNKKEKGIINKITGYYNMSDAIKKYLHKTIIGKAEVELIRELMIETGEKLVDFLPEANRTYFLISLLREGLKDYKNNQDFINQVLEFQDEENKEQFYWLLSASKAGLELIRNRPELQLDKNQALKDILQAESVKNITDYITNNKNSIDIEYIYKIPLKLKVVQTLEKCGLTFDQRILTSLNNEYNHKQPKELLNYISQYKKEAKEKNWNTIIIDMMHFLDRQIWDDHGKYKFQDAFGLITELKNIQQYSWGKKIDKDNWKAFSFNDALRSFGSNYKYSTIYDNQEEISKKVKETLQKNPIGFTEFNKLLITKYIDHIPSQIIEKAFHDNWKDMFRWDNVTRENSFTNRGPILENNKEPLLERSDIKKILIKEYLTQREKYKLSSWNEDDYLTSWGMKKTDIGTPQFFKKHKDILNMKTIENLCEIFKISDDKRKTIEKDYLDFSLQNNNEVKGPKLKL